MSADLTLNAGTFSSTEVSAKANTEAGRAFFAKHFGAGVVEVTMAKSGGLAMAAAAEKDGLTVMEE